MDIRLDLSKHCIQTEIKRQYNMRVAHYFKADTEDRKGLEEQIDLLHQALGAFDFPWLRATYPALSGGHDDEVILSQTADGEPAIQINGSRIRALR